MPKPDTPMYLRDEERYLKIAGNASAEVKQGLANGLALFMLRGKGFADSVGGRLQISKVDVRAKSEEPQRLEAIVICEIDVERGA